MLISRVTLSCSVRPCIFVITMSDDAGESPTDNLPFIAVAGVAVVTALFSAAAAALEMRLTMDLIKP